MWTSGETHTIHQHLQADPGRRMRPGEAPVSAAGNWWHQLQGEEHRTQQTVPSVGKGHCLVEEQGVPNFYNHHFQPLTVLHIKGFSLVLINCMKLCFSLENMPMFILFPHWMQTRYFHPVWQVLRRKHEKLHWSCRCSSSRLFRSFTT